MRKRKQKANPEQELVRSAAAVVAFSATVLVFLIGLGLWTLFVFLLRLW